MKYLLALLLISNAAFAESQPEPMEPDDPETPAPIDNGTVICGATQFVYSDGATKAVLDAWTLKRAKVRCGQLYPNSPCVKKIEKKPGPHYNVTCSGAK